MNNITIVKDSVIALMKLMAILNILKKSSIHVINVSNTLNNKLKMIIIYLDLIYKRNDFKIFLLKKCIYIIIINIMAKGSGIYIRKN
mgnify:CR=1 FL=1